MTPSVLVISNNRNSSITYMHSLRGYGYAVEDTHTFEAARILLRSGAHPQAIVIDVKFHMNEIADFVQFLRTQIQGSIHIVVIGCENESLLAYGVNACIERPADFQQIINILEMPIR